MEPKKDTSVKGIVKALGEFQQACPAISKEKTAGTGNFKYKYGSLPMILEVIKPHMKKAGLAFTQPIITEGEKEFILTTIYDMKTGETLEGKMELPVIKFQGMNELQSKGSAITYLRRYGIMSILGIVTEEDDNDAQGKTEPKPKRATNQAPAKPAAPELPWLNPTPKETWMKAVKFLADGGAIGDIKKKYRIGKNNEEKLLNDALTFDDLPFDRNAADGSEGVDIPGNPEEQSNLNFDNQAENP